MIPTLDVTISQMVSGDISTLQDYLDDSPDAAILLHGVDDSTGKTALHLAAAERFPDIVTLLLDRGADPNAQTSDGRTPLMEAALWGRLKHVQLLLAGGADKRLQCGPDKQRVRAIDFAKPGTANDEERHRRAGLVQENTHKRNQDRQAIVLLLEDDEEAEGSRHSGRSLAGYNFYKFKLPNGEPYVALVAHFDVPNKWKTIGVLNRGSRLPYVAAMSGWSHDVSKDSNIQIAGRVWTDEVLRLCEAIGHRLPRSNYDQGRPGMYHACHAEKQLVAYFVHKHVFLPHELPVERKPVECKPVERKPEDAGLVPGFAGLAVSGNAPRSSPPPRPSPTPRPSPPPWNTPDNQRKLKLLKDAQPPSSQTKSTIMVSTPVCEDCARFVTRVNQKFGLEIVVSDRF